MTQSNLWAALLEAQATRDPENEAAALRAVARHERKPDFSAGRSDLDRFLCRLIFGLSDCWIWTGGLTHLGYGALGRKIQGEHTAHRLAYRLFNGEIPSDLCVMHTCDVRCCVNPEHLVLGTQADNMRDMDQKGRRVMGDVTGEKNGQARLTREQVEQIRAAVAHGSTQRAMCREYGVSPMTVSRIVRKETWR